MDELFSKLKRPFRGTWEAVESNKPVFEYIMFRLPVKSILMFKSVSNFWYDVMSTKYFIILHRNWSKKYAKFFVFYDAAEDGIVREMRLMEPNGTYSESYVIPGFESIHSRPLFIASFNGLIFCINDANPYGRMSYDADLLICNPATREVLDLPSNHVSVYMPTFGVLYSNKYHIYKIFKFFSYDAIDFKLGNTQCEVYSSKTGKWESLGTVSSHPLLNPGRPLVSNHVCINEKLYLWIAYVEPVEGFDLPSSIVMVDMDNNYREIMLPIEAEITFLTEFQGRLGFVDWLGFNIYLWLYEESNGSWYLNYTLPFPVNWMEVAHFDSVAARKHEILFVYKDVVGLRHEILYDVHYATWEDFHITENAKDKEIAVFPFFETLFPCSKYHVFALG